ncbi:hypothetical protein XELAEV_18040626mg [Xenopus laevis]|uniref:Ig-like domain-containing protein n=1 Tax=Xenopus laevis TaxID=8355 RepID=A0A974CA03_XENLA|nr:hypothetical protein XELAEV_18040626mg [Xenopus laevis]
MENCSLTLSCNVTGPETRSFWENREASDGIKGNITLHVIYTNASSKYTCTAQNQISRVSRSVIPWTLCREVSESNETRPETQYIRATLVVFVPCFIIISAIISVYVWARHRHQLDADTAREEAITYAEPLPPQSPEAVGKTRSRQNDTEATERTQSRRKDPKPPKGPEAPRRTQGRRKHPKPLEGSERTRS